MIRAVGWPTPNTATQTQLGVADRTAKLGKYVLENPELRFQDIPSAPGHVGYEFLRRFAVTLDVSNRRLKFDERPPAGKKVPDENSPVESPVKGIGP